MENMKKMIKSDQENLKRPQTTRQIDKGTERKRIGKRLLKRLLNIRLNLKQKSKSQKSQNKMI